MIDTDDTFLVDTAALEAARTPRTRAVIVANPANPTGAVHGPERLADIAAWCLHHDIWLICDEIYDAFVYDGVAVPALAAAPQAASRVIVVNGVSKVHAMTGWRVGWLFGPRDVVTCAREQVGRTITHVPQLTQMAALAALGDDATPARAVNNYRRNRDSLQHHLNRIPGIVCPPPKGGMFAFPNVADLLNRGPWNDANDLADWLLTETHVAVVAGPAFGSEHHLRLNFTINPDRLDQAAHRLVSALT
jgi:aspartate aminotransferase